MSIGAVNPNQKIGNCEVCNATDVEIFLHYGNMWFCGPCWKKEEQATITNNTQEAIAKRVESTYTSNPVNNAIQTAKQLDSTIQVRTDLFNAATTAIMDLKKSIDEDPAIENKPYNLASALKERFEHFKTVVFELNEQLVEAGNHQKAIQVYLNTLANQLRAEERTKLGLNDISYKPVPPKSVRPIKTRQTGKNKIDKIELRKYAAELGVNEFTLMMVCVQKGVTPKAGALMLKNSIETAKAQSNQ